MNEESTHNKDEQGYNNTTCNIPLSNLKRSHLDNRIMSCPFVWEPRNENKCSHEDWYFVNKSALQSTSWCSWLDCWIRNEQTNTCPLLLHLRHKSSPFPIISKKVVINEQAPCNDASSSLEWYLSRYQHLPVPTSGQTMALWRNNNSRAYSPLSTLRDTRMRADCRKVKSHTRD